MRVFLTSGWPFCLVEATTENAQVWASIDLTHLQGSTSRRAVLMNESAAAEHESKDGPADMEVLDYESFALNLELDPIINW